MVASKFLIAAFVLPGHAEVEWTTLVSDSYSTCTYDGGNQIKQIVGGTVLSCKAGCSSNSLCNAVFYITEAHFTDGSDQSLCFLYASCDPNTLRVAVNAGSTYVRSSAQEADQTILTAQLNNQIRRGDNGVFTGGKGVLVRNPLDDYEEMSWVTVPATFWVNDIFTPTQLYVTAVAGNVDCPNDRTNGYYDLDACDSDPNDPTVTGGWDYASMAYVIGTHMDKVMQDYDNIQSEDWGFGVFYPSDSNGVDLRCHMTDSGDYDCPGGMLHDDGSFTKVKDQLGAGGYSAGNPDADPSWGGGTGCHFDTRLSIVDQTDAFDPATGENLVQDYNCQCNYNWKTGDEHDWWSFVENWINNAVPKEGTADFLPWFTGGKAPGRGLDLVSCWVNNPRDMIHIQNQFWWKREQWSNQMAPKSNWGKNPASHRVYWGWNEVPMANAQASDRNLRDAVMIRLPGAICTGTGELDTPTCLSDAAQRFLESDIDEWVNKGHLGLGAGSVGQHPGSDLVWVKAIVDDSGNWAQKFFCESWISPSNKYKVVFDGNKCYIDAGTAKTAAGGEFV